MTGHTVKRAGRWRCVLELGEQAALRCPTCRRRYFDGQPSSCPPDHGELEEVVVRRQAMLPDKFGTKKEAEKALRDELQKRERGTWVPPVDLSTGDHFTRWLAALGAEDLSPSTLVAYDLNVRRIVANIGHIPLQKLTRNDVAVMVARLATETSERKGKPLSASTRRGLIIVLNRGLNDAVAAGLLEANPAAGVKRPKVRRAEMHTWTGAELSTFLRATRDDRLGPLWHLLSLSGLRRGEALGLKWSDVDFANGRLAIQRQRVLTGYRVEERQTKSGKSRAVSLDAGTMAVLRRQSQQQLDDAAQWGDAWQSTGHSSRVRMAHPCIPTACACSSSRRSRAWTCRGSGCTI